MLLDAPVTACQDIKTSAGPATSSAPSLFDYSSEGEVDWDSLPISESNRETRWFRQLDLQERAQTPKATSELHQAWPGLKDGCVRAHNRVPTFTCAFSVRSRPRARSNNQFWLPMDGANGACCPEHQISRI